jgi:hypothetical protein
VLGAGIAALPPLVEPPPVVAPVLGAGIPPPGGTGEAFAVAGTASAAAIATLVMVRGSNMLLPWMKRFQAMVVLIFGATQVVSAGCQGRSD